MTEKSNKLHLELQKLRSKIHGLENKLNDDPYKRIGINSVEKLRDIERSAEKDRDRIKMKNVSKEELVNELINELSNENDNNDIIDRDINTFEPLDKKTLNSNQIDKKISPNKKKQFLSSPDEKLKQD